MSKLDKRAISTTLVIAIFLLSMITSMPISVVAHPDAVVTPATGGGAISADDTGVAWTELTEIVITEGLAEDINPAIPLVLTIPDGFIFDVTSAPDVVATAGFGMTADSPAAITETTITVTVIIGSSSDVPGVLTIGGVTPIMVRPDTGILASGEITMTAGMIAGVTGATSFGTLTMVPGADSQLVFSTEPDSTGDIYEVFTTQPVVRIEDQFGNLASSTATVDLTDVTAIDGTGDGDGVLTGTISLVAEAGVATFTDISYTETDTIYIKATSGVLTDAVSTTAITLDPFVPDPDFSIDSISKTTVKYGDVVTVLGSGVTSGSVVELYWDTAFGDNAHLLNSTEGNPDGTFECDFDVPSDVVGDHYIWVKDVATLTTVRSGPLTMLPKISLSPKSGLIDDKVTIKGYGFSADEDITKISYGSISSSSFITSPFEPETDELGYWTATFKVPIADSGDVRAEDDKGIWTSAYFTVGASISLSPSSGPVGSIVEVSGRGFTPSTPSSPIGDIHITFGGADCTVYDVDTIGADGEFDVKIIIPQVDDVDDFEITFTNPDDSTEYASDDFEVDGLAEIETEYAFGVQGTTIGIEGWNFTRISGKEVQLELWEVGGTSSLTDIEEFETDSKGHFSGTFQVPARSSDKYLLVADQDLYNIDGSTGFRIGLMLVLIYPTSGPTGTKVVLTGMGFTAPGTWNATFGGVSIIEDEDIDDETNLEKDGNIPTFIVPTLDVGQYTLVVNDITDEDSIISVSIEFMVTETTTLVTDPMVAPNEYDVEVKGKYFSEAIVDVEFVIYNSTDDWDMNIVSTPYPVVTDKDGNFTALWTVPENEILAVGDYLINATDDDGLFAQYIFSVVEKTVEIEPRKPSFALGETVYFDIESSFAMDGSYIEIYDPYDHLYWRTDLFEANEWLKVGTIERMPYYQQTAGGNPMTLMDATVGPWFWEMFYEDDPVCNGTFEVTPAPSDILTDKITALSGELDELAEDIAGVTDEIAGDIADLSSEISDVEANVQDMIDDITADLAEELAGVASDTEAAVDELEGSIGDIAAAQNELDSKLDDMGQDTAAAKQAAEDAQRTSQGVTTLVYGAIAASLIAALAAIVSLMQISKKIA